MIAPKQGRSVPGMRAAFVSRFDEVDPLAGLVVGELPDSAPLAGAPVDGWVRVAIRASSLNHHDLWSLRGVGLKAAQLPMVLGCDASGVTPDGDEVIVHPVVDDPGDPRGYSLLSERLPGTIAEWVDVPRDNLIAKPAGLSFADAACLPTAWLTAYRMLTGPGRIADAQSVLVQGAGGGVATAAVVLASALGARVYATSRDAAKRERIAALGATAVEPGGRLPERVDMVIETVGEATFEHSMKCAAPGARIVVCGATSGHLATVDLRRVFAMQLQIIGSSMGTRDDLSALLDLCVERGVRPVVDSTFGFTDAPAAFARLHCGAAFGKVVIDHAR
jgi:NADPH:quinone reductase-like Zn-dependent oxidoreductase